MRRLAGLAILLGMVSLGCERTTTPSTETEAPVPQDGAATRPDGSPAGDGSAIEIESPVIRDLRRRAEGGELSAMMTLGRAYQARGTEKDRAEARKWYEKADAAGGRAAKDAIAGLDAESRAAVPPPSFESSSSPFAAASPPSNGAAAPTQPSSASSSPSIPRVPPVAASAASSGPSSGPAAPSSAPSSTTTANTDPGKLTWTELVATYDSENFATVDKPDFKKNMFVGLSTAEDQTMILAATGSTGDDLRNIKLLIRVRSRQDPAEAQRVTQAAAIAARITHDNVSRADMVQWVKNYLGSEEKSEPVYRNGWEITVSGPAADRTHDSKNYLGNAVVIEFKK